MEIEVVSANVTPSEAAAPASSESPAQKENESEKKSPASGEKSQDESAKDSEALDHDEADENESAESDEESNDDDSKDEEQRPKKKNGFKKRIDKLNQRVSERERELEYWKAQALKGKEAPQEKQESVAQEKSQDLSAKPVADNFETHEEFVEALTDWKLEQRERAAEAKQKETQVKTEAQKQIEAHNARVKDFQKSQTDYTEVIQEFLEDHGDVQFSPALEEAVISSDLGPAVLYELAKNPEELLRINSMSYGAAQRAIGRIEARLEKPSEPKKEADKKLTKAPAPLSPVTGKGTSSAKSLQDMPYEDYKRERLAQMKKSKG